LIKDIPHWVHHGELDDIIPISASEEMVKALKGVGAKEVKFSRYPDAAHDSWTEAYNNPEVWRWMLDRKRRDGGNKVELPEHDKVDVELVK
jgi:predicted peptidase